MRCQIISVATSFNFVISVQNGYLGDSLSYLNVVVIPETLCMYVALLECSKVDFLCIFVLNILLVLALSAWS